MASPRRAALDSSDEVAIDSAVPRREAVAHVTEDATLTPADGARRTAWARRVIAPLAVVSAFSMVVVGAVYGPKETASDAVPEVAVTTVQRATSVGRSLQRPALPGASATPTASATPSVSAAPAPSVSATATPSATAASTPASSAPASPTAPATSQAPAFDPSVLGKAKGSAWVSANVNARKAPEKSADSVRVLPEHTKVSLTVLNRDGWQQIVLNGKAAWVRDTFLTTKEPAPTPTASPSASKASSASSSDDAPTSSGGFSTAACQHSSGIESGLTTRTRSVFRAVCGQFPSITSYGGRRSSGGYHGSGRAIDVMVSGDFGWTVAKWVRANASKLGVIEVIYAQKIWTAERSGDGWRSMSDRGSATANHYDHVHISVR